MEEKIFLTESCLATLIASCLETPHKETGGFLVGKKEKRVIYGERTPCLTLDAAYPVQTRRSGKGYWQPGNWAAYLRTIGTIRAMKFDIVGEYHSHISGVAELSEDDMKFIKGELVRFESKSVKIQDWIEMVLNIKKKEYQHEQTPKCNWTNFAKKIRCNIKGIRNKKVGYVITFAAYWFNPKDLTFKEAIVHIP